MKYNSIKLLFDIHSCFFSFNIFLGNEGTFFVKKMELQWNWKYRKKKKKIFKKFKKKIGNHKKVRNHRYHDEEGRQFFLIFSSIRSFMSAIIDGNNYWTNCGRFLNSTGLT